MGWGWPAGKQIYGEGPGVVLVDNRLSTSQQGALRSMKVNGILGDICKSEAKAKRGDPDSALCTGESNLTAVSRPGLPQQRQGVIRVSLTDSYKMVKDVQPLSARKGWGASRRNGTEGTSLVCTSIWMGLSKGWCQTPGKEALGTKWNRKFHLSVKNFFTMRVTEY